MLQANLESKPQILPGLMFSFSAYFVRCSFDLDGFAVLETCFADFYGTAVGDDGVVAGFCDAEAGVGGSCCGCDLVVEVGTCD